jgi:hypothetical protein
MRSVPRSKKLHRQVGQLPFAHTSAGANGRTQVARVLFPGIDARPKARSSATSAERRVITFSGLNFCTAPVFRVVPHADLDDL